MKDLFFIDGKNEVEIIERFSNHFLSIAVKDNLHAEFRKGDELINNNFSILFDNAITTVINLELIKYNIDNAIEKLPKKKLKK